MNICYIQERGTVGVLFAGGPSILKHLELCKLQVPSTEYSG